MKNKDKYILKHILKYCKQIEETLNTYNNEKKAFLNNHIFKNAISMIIFQIGELSNHLKKEYKMETSNEINWIEVSGMRNHFAHGYGDMDINRIWDTAINDIPVLKKFCIKEIKRLDSAEDKKEGND